MDIFTNPIPPFNAQIRIQKKLLGIMRFSESLKIEILGTFFRYFARFLVIWACLYKTTACLRRNNVLFYQKQHVISSISRDIFQIKSDEISFSSEKIRKNSEKIEKSSRIRAKFLGRMILNSRRMHYFLSSLLEIMTKIRLAI